MRFGVICLIFQIIYCLGVFLQIFIGLFIGIFRRSFRTSVFYRTFGSASLNKLHIKPDVFDHILHNTIIITVFVGETMNKAGFYSDFI